MRRVLSIDGGGIKGAWPAAFLACIQEATMQRVVDTFDLIVGTSTGGIIALGLGLGLHPAEIVRLYAEQGPRIFEPPGPAKPFRRRWRASGRLPGLCSMADQGLGTLVHVLGPKHSGRALKTALEQVFGTRLFGESETRLVVPAFNARVGQVQLFKTAHHARFERDHRATAVDVALATAAAPTYFPAHATQVGSILVDGGVWANNPAGLAVVEAVAVLGWKPDEIRLLSLGCTDQPLALPRRASAWWGHLPHVIELMFRGQAEGSMGTASLLLGHTELEPKLFRRTHVVNRGTFSLDAADQVTELVGLGRKDARQFLPIYRRVFLGERRDPFIPYHGTRSTPTGRERGNKAQDPSDHDQWAGSPETHGGGSCIR